MNNKNKTNMHFKIKEKKLKRGKSQLTYFKSIMYTKKIIHKRMFSTP